jgi:hypothetical protein
MWVGERRGILEGGEMGTCIEEAGDQHLNDHDWQVTRGLLLVANNGFAQFLILFIYLFN